MSRRTPPGIDWSKVITDRPPPVRPAPRRAPDGEPPPPIEVFDLLGAPALPPPRTA